MVEPDAWKRDYLTEFVRFALTRNWTEENAAVWADEIADDARVFGVPDPKQQARDDVLACERESENAA